MNQILSVEMPNQKSKSKKGDKASTKSVIIFMCIVLIVFGLALSGIALFSIMNSNKKQNGTIKSAYPRIDISQNATELDIDISTTNDCEITSIEYKWEEKETEKIKGNAKNTMNLKVDIPSGANIFTIKAIDSKGRENEYSQQYIGGKEPNITVFDPSQDINKIIANPSQEMNKITIQCEENQPIKYLTYYYDDEQEVKEEINNKVGTIRIKALQGEHNLTIKAGYEDGTEGKLSKKVYAPTITVEANGVEKYDKFIVSASDPRIIDKVVFYFNGTITEEQVNSENYTKEFDLQPGTPGSNLLIVVAYNKDGMVITKGVKDSNRKN